MQYTSTQLKQAQLIVKKAEATRSPASKIIRSFCDAVNLPYSSSVFVGPQKSQDRLLEKAAINYGGDLSQVRDPTRFMATFGAPSKIPEIRSALIPGRASNKFQAQIEKSGFRVHGAVKDFFANPKRWGYMGFLIRFDPIKKGKYGPFELQVTHSGLQDRVYPQTHELYETVRTQVESYDRDGVDFAFWDSDVKNVLREMLRHHYNGAAEYNILDYISSFPTLAEVQADDPDDDIANEEFSPVIAV